MGKNLRYASYAVCAQIWVGGPPSPPSTEGGPRPDRRGRPSLDGVPIESPHYQTETRTDRRTGGFRLAGASPRVTGAVAGALRRSAEDGGWRRS
ncbi:hypothetical protein NL676_018900 [Syzygium grande]|nr:hypothetical protein NL676_018900 [Syzygium grande]